MATAQTDVKKAAKNGAAAGRKNAIAGFHVAKVNPELVRDYIESRGLKLDAGETDEQRAVALALHLREKVPAEKQVRCENCGAISSEDEDACPFCGDAGDVLDEDGDVIEAAAESAPSVAEAAPEEDSDDEEEAEEDSDDEEEAEDEDGEDAAEETAPAEEEEAAEEEDAEEETEAEAAPVAAPAKTKKSAGEKSAAKKEGKTMATTHETNGVAKKANGAALEKASEGKLSAKDLDKAVSRVQQLKGEGYVNYWKLGQEIFVINKEQLWKLRKTEEGKSRYKSFDAFVHHELGMSPTHAYNAIECAKNYKSADEIRELGGTSKAALILKAAPQDQPALKEKAKAGATKRELEKEVAASRKKNGSGKTSQQAKAGAKGKAAQTAAKAKTAEKITVANITGSRTIKLYKKPDSLKGIKWPPEKRARTVGDLPFGRLELQPGVVQYFSVLSKDGELVLNVQTVREEG